MVSQPTWGVDAGAAAAIHQALFNLAGAGAAVLVISQDLDELLTLTDRLAVINVGVLSGTMVTADASLDEIGLLMGGLHGMDEHVPSHEGHRPGRSRTCRLRSRRGPRSAASCSTSRRCSRWR